MRVTHASLFSGIGGFDLAAEWMGWENVFQVEIDKFCTKVLEKNFPNAKRYGDIKQFDGKPYRGAIDVLTGGFPCQPFSTAGKREGTEDDRHLWPEMLRVIGEIQPGFIVGENVYGLVNWSEGLVFEQVQTDLEVKGYEVTSIVLPACGVNAPHRRDRIWFVAHSADNYRRSTQGKRDEKREYILSKPKRSCLQRASSYTSSKRWDNWGDNRQKRHIQKNKRTPTKIQSERKGRKRGAWKIGSINTNANNKGLQGSEIDRSIGEIREKRNEQPTRLLSSTWEEFPTQSPICGGDDGIPNRMDRIKSLGNAVVPQIVYSIFKALNV